MYHDMPKKKKKSLLLLTGEDIFCKSIKGHWKNLWLYVWYHQFHHLRHLHEDAFFPIAAALK